MTTKESVYDPGWFSTRIVKYVVGKPLWWALEQMGIVTEENGTGSVSSDSKDWWGEYVVLGLVEKAADAVVEMQRSRTVDVSSALYSMEGFRQTFEGVLEGVILSTVDMKVLLRYLERDRGILIIDRGVCFFIVIQELTTR
jgi:charged multivesicular body protein 7